MACVRRIVAALALLAVIAVFSGAVEAKIKAAPSKPQPPVPECAPVGVMAKRLMQERKLAYHADAIDSTDRVHMWYVARDGRWAEVEVDDDKLEACVVAEGYDWHFASGR